MTHDIFFPAITPFWIVDLTPTCLFFLGACGSSARKIKSSITYLDSWVVSFKVIQVNILVKSAFIFLPKLGNAASSQKRKCHMWVKNPRKRSITGVKQCSGNTTGKVQERCPPPQWNGNLDSCWWQRDQQDQRKVEQQLKQQEQWKQGREKRKWKWGAEVAKADRNNSGFIFWTLGLKIFYQWTAF